MSGGAPMYTCRAWVVFNGSTAALIASANVSSVTRRATGRWTINPTIAIGHAIRRAMRDEEFAPLDAVIMKQIPGTDTAAIEAQRQAIRDKCAGIQTQIDAAATPEAIKVALGIE